MGSGKDHRKGKKGFGKGEFRDKEGGKGNRSENYKQVRLKLHGDRLHRGWRDQPNRGTTKGRNRPHFAQIEDLLTRTRFFKCGELGHLARNCSQKKEDDPSLFSGDRDVVTGSEAFFSSIVCHDYNDKAVFCLQPKRELKRQRRIRSVVRLRLESFLSTQISIAARILC